MDREIRRQQYSPQLLPSNAESCPPRGLLTVQTLCRPARRQELMGSPSSRVLDFPRMHRVIDSAVPAPILQSNDRYDIAHPGQDKTGTPSHLRFLREEIASALLDVDQSLARDVRRRIPSVHPWISLCLSDIVGRSFTPSSLRLRLERDGVKPC